MPECFDGSAAPQQGMLGALIVWWPASFWLQWTMAEGTVHTGSPAQFPTKPTEEWKKIRKMYAIKQIKICAEYRDMLLRPRLDLSGTPRLRPIGLSPGSWQTSLGLGSMSRYSAQILICITMIQPICMFVCRGSAVCVSKITHQKWCNHRHQRVQPSSVLKIKMMQPSPRTNFSFAIITSYGNQITPATHEGNLEMKV